VSARSTGAAGSAQKPGKSSSARPKKPRPKVAEQPMMKALRAEHRHIATVMQLFADQLKAIEEGQLVDTHVVYEIMDYMVSWPDRFHHPREDLIYGRVAEIDSKTADEVDTLQRDHDRTAVMGRQVLQDINRWREGDVSGAAVVKSGRQYIDHTYEHMNLEEKLVFPHIESVLSLQDWRELS
jgi:hemerythrin-like domain-containing protein